ncbi:MAG: helix-turn-helix transcriptional regulator [Candidatus Velthaea sp.]|jgi:poly-beta-hydroxybutyrate-responsive repressor
MKSPVDHGAPPRGTPKNYLVAWLLVVLRRSPLHGYEIVKDLRDEFGIAVDSGTVYRTLRALEADALIRSHWDPHDHGPARRVYELTEAGLLALGRWSEALRGYRSNLDAFFRVFDGALAPSGTP